MENLSSTRTLANGVKMPCIGYGTWQTPAGGQATVGNLYNVFIVHGAARYWGYALGQRNGQNPYFQPNGVGGADSAIWIAHNAENRPMHSSRTYRDGIEVDPFTTGQGTGIHVIEVDCLEMRQSAQCFYNDRDMWKDANGYKLNDNDLHFRDGEEATFIIDKGAIKFYKATIE